MRGVGRPHRCARERCCTPVSRDTPPREASFLQRTRRRRLPSTTRRTVWALGGRSVLLATPESLRDMRAAGGTAARRRLAPLPRRENEGPPARTRVTLSGSSDCPRREDERAREELSHRCRRTCTARRRADRCPRTRCPPSARRTATAARAGSAAVPGLRPRSHLGTR